MKKTKHSVKDSVASLLFQSAQGFYEIGFNTGIELKINSEIKICKIVPAAVNMSFAAELFLKGLYFMEKKEQFTTHSLQDLFNKLSLPMRQKIEENYHQYHLNSMTNNELVAFQFKIVKSDKLFPKTKHELGFPCLTDFLKLHDKCFEDWRYIYEVKQDQTVLDIDFKSFACLINGIKDLIVEIIKTECN